MDGLPKRRRLDWELIAPPKAGAEERYVSVRAALDSNYAMALAAPADVAAAAAVADVELEFESVALFKCDVVEAPRVDDDPDWESRVIDEFGMLDAPIELEEYLETRRTEPDCDHCPYASRYSVFPMAPCEFSVGGLLEVLADHPDLLVRLKSNMAPAAMLDFADCLSGLLPAENLVDLECVDTRDYMDQAAQFLRFWARHGFAVRPVDIDADLVTQAHAEMMAGGAGSTLH